MLHTVLERSSTLNDAWLSIASNIIHAFKSSNPIGDIARRMSRSFCLPHASAVDHEVEDQFARCRS